MKFGIHIGHMGGPLDEMRKLWRFADDMGFDWSSVSDHFQESPPRGGEMDGFGRCSRFRAKRVRSSALFGADPRDLAMLRDRQRCEQLRNQTAQICNAIGLCT